MTGSQTQGLLAAPSPAEIMRGAVPGTHGGVRAVPVNMDAAGNLPNSERGCHVPGEPASGLLQEREVENI